MANWFPMALKDGARSWLLNLPAGSISSCGEIRNRFIANFQGTRDCPSATGDLRHIKQQPEETLQKYIQRFNNTRLKIPKVTDEAIISAFSDGVREVKMKRSLSTRSSAHLRSCSTWRPSAQELRRGASLSLSCQLLTQKRRSPRSRT